jgi:hypothetical protein
MTQQYSWPAPVPPWGRKGTVKLIRCARCKGPLYRTTGRGQPRQEDHEQGCEAYITAMRVMRYVEELKRAASQPDQGAWRSTRRRRKYLRTGAKEMSVAACQPDPAAAITALGDLYQAECQKRGTSAKVTELTEMAEMLMRACRQLARGQHPAPIVSGSE